MMSEILFQSPIGILSILTVVGVVVMGSYILYFVLQGMKESKDQ